MEISNINRSNNININNNNERKEEKTMQSDPKYVCQRFEAKISSSSQILLQNHLKPITKEIAMTTETKRRTKTML